MRGVRTLFFIFAALSFALFACGAEPPPMAKSANEYLATIKRDPAVADVRVFVGPPIIRKDNWTDDDEPRIIRSALGEALAAMGFAIVKMDNEADAIARIRVTREPEKTPAYELEFLRGSFEVDSFKLEDATLSYGTAGRDDRLRRAYTRMLSMRAGTITKSQKITALAGQRAAELAASAKAAAPPPPKPPPPPPPPVANDREKAIAWIQATAKAGASSAIVTSFTQQLDSIIDAGKDGQWQLGWGVTKDGMARIARWRAGTFETRSITPVEATSQGMTETSNAFTTAVRGSLGPLGPNSAPPPPTAPPPPPPPLPPNTEVGKGRDAAIAWLNAHCKAPQTANSIVEQIDDVIKGNTKGDWKIGWALTQSVKAYLFTYNADGSWTATEIAVDAAQAQGFKAYAVTFSKYDR